MLSIWKNSKIALLTVGAVSLCTFGATGCGTGPKDGTSVQPTPQGTIELSVLEVAMPESTFRDAVITFVPDPKGSVGGKNQYLSRGQDQDGGQFVSQCKNDQCFELQVYYRPPVPKDKALQTLQNILPKEAGTETSIDDTAVKAGKENMPVEIHNYSNKDYHGELVYADKNANSVAIVNAWYMPALAK